MPPNNAKMFYLAKKSKCKDDDEDNNNITLIFLKQMTLF